MAEWIYYADQELPALAISWRDASKTLIDYSSGWTFRVEILTSSGTAVARTKTTGITGAATAPNLVAAFTAEELAGLAKNYKVRFVATRDGLDNVFRPGDLPELWIHPVPTPAA